VIFKTIAEVFFLGLLLIAGVLSAMRDLYRVSVCQPPSLTDDFECESLHQSDSTASMREIETVERAKVAPVRSIPTGYELNL
jgi:hypothetical protein